jgi:hypothetical protein
MGRSFLALTAEPNLGDPESDLPGAVYDLLVGGEEKGSHKSFPDPRAAEESFQAAWLAARERGWRADG